MRTIGHRAFVALVAAGIVAPACAQFGPPPVQPDADKRPAGIRLEASKLGRVYADAAGHTLYQFGNDQFTFGGSNCVEACARQWPPLLVTGDPGQLPSGWSVVQRPDGSRQWAIGMRPVYRYSGDNGPGDTNGDNINAGQWIAARPADKPPVIEAPAGIHVVGLGAKQVVVTAAGQTLYVSRAAAKAAPACRSGALPVQAAALARPINGWTIVELADGTRQWAYRNQRLYTAAADVTVGDTNGEAPDCGLARLAVR